MTKFLLQTVVLALAMLGSATAEPGPVRNCSRTEPSGERTLCHESVVAASAADVWALWTTAEGFSSWAAPVAAVDLRAGGGRHGSYRDLLVTVSAPRVKVAFASSWPSADIFARAQRRLGSTRNHKSLRRRPLTRR